QPVAQLLAPDQPDVIDAEHRDAQPDHEADTAPLKAERERRAEQREYQTRGGDGGFLLDLHLVRRYAYERAVQALVFTDPRAGCDVHRRGLRLRWPRHSGGRRNLE